MSRLAFTVLCIAIVLLVLALMWLAWRARAKRDEVSAARAQALSGSIVAEFERVSYVSTTPVGEPFTRIAMPGLRYKGNAELTVRADGVTIQVYGEYPVHIGLGQLRGTAAAGVRVGKAVEPGGLALLLWDADTQGAAPPVQSDGVTPANGFETSFRFTTHSEQHNFEAALADIMNDHTTLEDA